MPNGTISKFWTMFLKYTAFPKPACKANFHWTKAQNRCPCEQDALYQKYDCEPKVYRTIISEPNQPYCVYNLQSSCNHSQDDLLPNKVALNLMAVSLCKVNCCLEGAFVNRNWLFARNFAELLLLSATFLILQPLKGNCQYHVSPNETVRGSLVLPFWRSSRPTSSLRISTTLFWNRSYWLCLHCNK